jgi:hypothetical protein
MNLKLVSFADSGKLDRERVVLRATKDLDTGDYTALCSVCSDPGSATSGLQTAYWFPDGEIKAGDLVVLYTKSGKEGKKDIGAGHTAYFFYWGLSKPLWNTSKLCLVLIEGRDFAIEWPAESIAPEEEREPSSDAPAGETTA